MFYFGKTDMNNEPGPEKVMDTAFAYATTRVLVSGVDLEVFTHIANGNHTVADIAKAADAGFCDISVLDLPGPSPLIVAGKVHTI